MNPQEQKMWDELQPRIFQCKYCLGKATYYVNTHDCDLSLVCTAHYVGHEHVALDMLTRVGAIRCANCKQIFKKYEDWLTFHIL